MTAGVRQERRHALRALPPSWPRLPTLLDRFPVVAGVAYRLGLLFSDTPQTNSDEATMGLAALHIAQGRDFPVWFYGQRYMGTLEAYLAAPVFALAGRRPSACGCPPWPCTRSSWRSPGGSRSGSPPTAGSAC